MLLRLLVIGAFPVYLASCGADGGGLEAVVIDRTALFLQSASPARVHAPLGDVALLQENPFAETIFVVDSASLKLVPSAQIESIGSLKITQLLTNEVFVCGSTGTERCTIAGLRIYTNNAPGAGLWNASARYGAPIYWNGKTIRLGASAARNLKRIKINRRTEIKLSDFVATGPFEIPLSVDFTNAPAGDYATTLVVEFFMQ